MRLLVLLALATWLYFYLVALALGRIVDLAISKIILIRCEITVSFLG